MVVMVVVTRHAHCSANSSPSHRDTPREGPSPRAAIFFFFKSAEIRTRARDNREGVERVAGARGRGKTINWRNRATDASDAIHGGCLAANYWPTGFYLARQPPLNRFRPLSHPLDGDVATGMRRLHGLPTSGHLFVLRCVSPRLSYY